MRKTMLISLMVLLLLSAVGSQSSRAAPAAPAAIVPGDVQVDATFEHLGVLWWISGDDDLDSTLTLEFRQQGESAWQPGAPGMRAYPSIRVQDAPLGLNYWAASAMFLEAGSTYELRLTLNDPDGGGETRTLSATTRSEPQSDPAGRQLYVIPGSSGGDGSAGDPFQGLQTAADAAQPGDTFHIAAGTYAPLQILISGTPGHPVTFSGPSEQNAIIEGANTDRGVVTVGNYDRSIAHIILEGLTIQNGRWGIDAQHSQDIVIRRNVVRDVDFGIYNRRGDAQERNQTVCDNLVEGRTAWPGSGIPSERGIDLRGTGNVVCHNTVRYFGDCISVQPSTGASYGNDVYGNDAAYCVDDGIEIDYNQANVRVWRNRVTNARMGVSVQPIRGGPAYIFRNEFFNLESVPIKMHNYTSGFYVLHNSGVKHGDGHGDNGAMWRNAIFRNNLFLGTRYAFEFTTVADEGFRDFDHNAWGTTRTSTPFFKWDNQRYDTIADLPAGVEDHGVAASFDDLVNATLPAAWDSAAIPGEYDLRLQVGAEAINAGVALANLNAPFTLSGAADAGAFEYGQPLPHYGPRVQGPDLSPSYKQANPPTARLGERVTYSIGLLNVGAELSGALALSDTLPGGLSYIPGSLVASSGTVDDSSAPLLRWTGNLDSNTPVTLSYAVSVTQASAGVLINEAYATVGSSAVLTRSASLLVNGRNVYLPLLLKGS